MSPTCPVRPLTVAVAAAALLAGCGGGSGAGGAGSSNPAAPTATALAENGVADLPATEILAKAKAALTQASSVHIMGGGFSEGQQFALDMRYGTAGAAGSLTANGQVIELRRVRSTVYLEGTEAFWRSVRGTAAAELLKGRYLEVPANRPDFAELTGFTDLEKNAAELVMPDGEITKGERRTVHGIEAIALDSSKGGTLYIALRGEPYPLQAVSSAEATSGETGSLDFLDYGVPVTVTAPPADQVVDISKLGGG